LDSNCRRPQRHSYPYRILPAYRPLFSSSLGRHVVSPRLV
jgi:hypothetical protein